MGLFKNFKKAAKKAAKATAKVSTAPIKQVKTIKKIVRGKARRKLRFSDVFGLTTIQSKRKPITITNVRRKKTRRARRSKMSKKRR